MGGIGWERSDVRRALDVEDVEKVGSVYVTRPFVAGRSCTLNALAATPLQCVVVVVSELGNDPPAHISLCTVNVSDECIVLFQAARQPQR